jgi:antitoxin component of RelBE/YafQ-DinJ toxin-antitoxin module
MVLHVQHVEGEYRVVLTPEAIAALNLTDGAPVEVLPVKVAEPTERRYATNAEVLQAFRETLPQHEEAYRELAK